MAVSILDELESLNSSMGAVTLEVSCKMASSVSFRLEDVSDVEVVGNWAMALEPGDTDVEGVGSASSSIVRQGGDWGSGKFLSLMSESSSTAALRLAKQASLRCFTLLTHSPGLGLTDTVVAGARLDA